MTADTDRREGVSEDAVVSEVLRGRLSRSERRGWLRPDRLFHRPSGVMKEGCMEPVKVFDKKDEPLDWEYDDDADTLYLSFGEPRPATGLDIGEGIVVRFGGPEKGSGVFC